MSQVQQYMSVLGIKANEMWDPKDIVPQTNNSLEFYKYTQSRKHKAKQKKRKKK